MCADCHSTLVERRYDLAADRFDTRWAELSVGCEACHGPGAEHVRAAKAGNRAEAIASLAVRLKPSEPWMPSATGSPAPRIQEGVEVEVCAPCHSRREPLKEGFLASDPFLDSLRARALAARSLSCRRASGGRGLRMGLVHPEPHVPGGRKCSDCHNPHSGKPFAEGNALCVRCHEPARFDVTGHSHHAGVRTKPSGRSPTAGRWRRFASTATCRPPRSCRLTSGGTTRSAFRALITA